jgi:serine/threonine protein kinase
MPVRIESQAEPIPGYRLLQRLGGGGFGEVWKAEAPGGLLKAVKFVYGDLQCAGDEGMRAEQELKAMSRVKTVRHPYILSLERYDIIDGQLIIVMELADRNLWDRFKECRAEGLPGIPREELLGYMEETAEALDLMNCEYQLQHLDIKPQNLFLIHNHVKVADFGLVKDLEGMVASVTGGVTPVYAAPETFDGYVSRFCDQYSLAIVFQELLSGVRAFSGNNVRQLIMQHLQGVPNLSALSANDRPVIARALAKKPDERHPSCRDLVKGLRGGAPASAGNGREAKDAGPKTPPAPAFPPRPLTGNVTLIRGHVAAEARAPAPSPSPGSLSSSVENLELPLEMTPRSTTHVIRARAPAASVEDQADSSLPKSQVAPLDDQPEAAGDGVLLPAVIVGLGHYGLAVLQCLRAELHERFDSLDALPHLHWLYVDTDPEALQQARRAAPESGLRPDEIFLTRLKRPSQYLKARDGRDGRPCFDPWFDPQILYRIPRTQLTTGLRVLGRLAFCDHHAAVARRLDDDLEACMSPDALTAAAQTTQLVTRRRRPRVYVVSSLAGGTGSGMFLDLAYVVRDLLRQRGYSEQDVVGLLLLPAADRQPGRTMALGNTFAALTELSHFMGPGQSFTARYEDKAPPLRDAGAPLNRCIVLPLSEEGDEEGGRGSVGRAADLLFRELLTPLGQMADQRRAELAPSRRVSAPSCQTFGLFRFAFPKQALIRRGARRLCQQLVQHWMSKDCKPLQEMVQAWVQDQWTGQELGADCYIASLQEGCARALGQAPESMFSALVESLLTGQGEEGCGSAPSGNGKSRGSALPAISPEATIDMLKQLDQLVGVPGPEALNHQTARLAEVLREVSAALVGQWGQKLTALVSHLVDEPEYRLAGAEEAIHQLIARIENALQHHEPLAKELANRASCAYGRIHGLLRGWNNIANAKARAAAAAELTELLRSYPKWRYQGLLLQNVAAAYVSLRGNLSDQLREVNFCRVRLGELLHLFAEEPTISPDPQASSPPAEWATRALPSGTVRHLFPDGCQSLDQAGEHLLATVTPEEFQELDRRVQAMIRQDFHALAHICLTSANLLKNVQLAMHAVAAGMVEQRLADTDVAELFLEQYPDEQTAVDQIVSAFDEAAPDLAGARGGQQDAQLCILAVPTSPAGERLQSLARQALPDVAWIAAAGADDIAIYRETPQLPIAELEQLGLAGQDAYRQMTSVEHFTPHSRTDIAFTHA